MAEQSGPRRVHWIARPAVPLGHEGLLTLARKVRAAASDSDPERLDQASRRFVEALDRHVRAEAAAMRQTTPAQARILRRGQERILAVAADLVVDAGKGCQQPGRDCRSRAEELVALLSLQARDEHHALDRSAA